MFYLSYVFAELRRRSGRTLLTALGLAVGVALVITVNALSSGLNQAQAKVLAPLTGVGTDMSVTRPLRLSAGGGSPFANLSPSQRRQLRSENGGGRLGLRNLKPGQHFSSDRFLSSGQLGFPASEVSKISSLRGVQAAAGSLTLNDVHVSGTVPKAAPGTSGGFRQGSGAFGQRPGFGQGSGGFGGGFSGPRNINFNSRSITGVDPRKPSLAALTPSQVTRGRYFDASDSAYAAILSSSYADSQNLSVGGTVKVAGKRFHIIGLASAPLGGTASDVYVKLATLQDVAGWKGQINTMRVRAASGGDVTAVQQDITANLKGAQVTTAKDLAQRVTGSLTDARNLSNTLGRALELVGLLAAILIASLLTLASVAKRVREIGTLRAVGWSKALVVRQISLEAIMQGLIGGVLGAVLGLIGVAVVNAMGWTLQATLPGQSPQGGPFGFGRFIQPAAASNSTPVHIIASVDLTLIAAAVGLAALGGLIAGVAGGLRAARLRPASALRTVE